MHNPPALLIEALNRNRAIAIVGSGLSVPAGAPSWEDLLYGLAAYADEHCFAHHRTSLASALQEIRKGKFLQAASLIKQNLGEIEFRNTIVWSMSHAQEIRIDWSAVENVFREPAARFCERVGDVSVRALKPSPTHRILMQLGFRAVLTTNYDWLLESALASFDVASFSYSYPYLAELVQSSQRFILHLHGDLRNQRDLVLAEDDFQRLQYDQNYLKPLEALFGTSIPLWLGYGHNDPDLSQITLKLPRLGLQGGYQLVKDEDQSLETATRGRGITPLPVKSYDEVPAFLSCLADRVKKRLTLSVRIDLPVADHQEMHRREMTIRHTLTNLGYNLDEVTEGLGTPAHLLFNALNLMGRNVTNSFLADFPKTPKPLLEPKLGLEAGSKQIRSSDLFQSWKDKRAAKEGRQVAIVAPPGAGKTVLLSQFAHWLQSQPLAGEDFGELVPIILLLTPASIPESRVLTASFSGEVLWNQIRRRASAVGAGYYSVEQSGFLEPFREAGLIYLLFDGLDEFGARRRGDLEHLTSALRYLAQEKQIHVFLTCRKVFWEQQVQSKDDWQQVEILPFSTEQINARVPYPGLGRLAYDEHHQPRPGVFNPLIASFVIELGESGKAMPEFRTRWDLYHSWARNAAENAHERMGQDAKQWLDDFQTIAYKLLKEERLSAPPLKRESGPIIQFHEYLATEILVPSGDGYGLKFFHESVQEFFVAWYLANSFLDVLQDIAPEKLRRLALAGVDLDFHQTSIYGFLYERLGEDYLAKLLRALGRADLMQWPDRLLRNLVEYVGMTYRGREDARALATWLTTLLKNDSRKEIRYNAARALERIHPWAPRPYFDYMSDWGDRDWNNERRRALSARVKPWAIRGQRTTDSASRRHPGASPPLAIYRDIQIDLNLQLEMSSELIAFIYELLSLWNSNKSEEVDWLLINSSYALVRWYHTDHYPDLCKLREKAEQVKASMQVQSNLKEWVGHPLYACPQIQFPFLWTPSEYEQPAQVIVMQMAQSAVFPVPSVQGQWNHGLGIIRGAKDFASGELLEDHVCERLDENGRVVPSERRLVGWNEIRLGVWSVADHLRDFQKHYSALKAVAWVGNGNLLCNPHFVAFTRHQGGATLYRLQTEETHLEKNERSRKYTCLVVWRDNYTRGNKKVTIEKLRFWYEDQRPQVFSEDSGRLITNEIDFATFGQQLISKGRPIDLTALVNMAVEGQFYDLRHLFLFGRIERGEQRWLDVGLSAFWDGQKKLNTDALVTALNGGVTKIDVSQFREDAIRAALLAKGYSEKSSPRGVGDFNLRTRKLLIGLKPGIYPHTMIGVKDNGALIVAAIRGLSNRVGVTVLGAATIMKSLGAEDAILLDNGRDVSMGRPGESDLGFGDSEERRLRAMIFFSCPNEEGYSDKISLLEFPEHHCKAQIMKR